MSGGEQQYEQISQVAVNTMTSETPRKLFSFLQRRQEYHPLIRNEIYESMGNFVAELTRNEIDESMEVVVANLEDKIKLFSLKCDPILGGGERSVVSVTERSGLCRAFPTS